MRNQIIVTIALLIVTAAVTIKYFRNLNPPGMRTSRVISNIPDDASLIFQYNNDKSFYEIFKGNKLFPSFAGGEKMGMLDTLSYEVLHNPLFDKYFSGQNIFISIHPSPSDLTDILITATTTGVFNAATLTGLAAQKSRQLVITPFELKGKKGLNIYITDLKKRFYLILKTSNIICGSFSKQLIEKAAAFDKPGEQQFTLLSEQQRVNSLVNVYINYQQLNNIFSRLFIGNTDILKTLRLLPAMGALTLNYRSDALMFNGTTTLMTDKPAGYLNLFSRQSPVENHLKEIFPSTTAYSVNFGISDAGEFKTALIKREQYNGSSEQGSRLFRQITAETSINLKNTFYKLLGDEFAVVTTRYFEKLAIISVKDGSKVKQLLSGVSTTADGSFAALSYEQLPFYLLGDAFVLFKKPYYTIIDNYLVLANSPGELASYSDTYLNRKFLSINPKYKEFDNLPAGRSNINFLFHFKNAQQLLKRDMGENGYRAFVASPGWSNFYAASWQFSGAENNFYTNFCMKMNADTIAINSGN